MKCPSSPYFGPNHDQIGMGTSVRIPTNPTRRSDLIRPPIGAKRRRSRNFSIVVGLRQIQGFGQSFPHRLSFHADFMGIVNKAVKDRVGDGGVADQSVPFLHG